MSEWPRYRSLIRRYLLIGDVALRDSSYDTPKSHNGAGLDTDSRCQLMSLLTGLAAIGTEDQVAYQLLRRDIGAPCTLRVHGGEPGHCHRIPRYKLSLIEEMGYEEIDERTEKAIAWLLSVSTDYEAP